MKIYKMKKCNWVNVGDAGEPADVCAGRRRTLGPDFPLWPAGGRLRYVRVV